MRTSTPAARGEVVPQPYVWDRAWIVLGRPHLEYISRKAHELGLNSPSFIVQKLIEAAMDAEDADRRPDSEAIALFDSGGRT